LQDQAEILAQAALDGVVEGEVEDGAGCFAVTMLPWYESWVHLRAVLSEAL